MSLRSFYAGSAGRLFGSDGLKQRPYPRGQQTVRVPVQMHAVFNGQLRGGEGRVDRLHVVEDGTEVLRGPPQDVVEGLPVGLKILEPVFREHGVDLLLVDGGMEETTLRVPPDCREASKKRTFFSNSSSPVCSACGASTVRRQSFVPIMRCARSA